VKSEHGEVAALAATSDDALLEEAKGFIAVGESGDASQAAFEQAAIRIDAWMKRRPGATQREAAAKIGKSRNYVNKLLLALSRARVTSKPFRVDWKSGSNERKTILEQAEPEALIEALHGKIEQAEPEERQKLAAAVTNTKTIGGRVVENAVVERELARKRAEAARKPEPSTTGIPIPLLYASICVQMTKWHQEMTRFTDDDLAELADGNPDGAERVARVVDGVESQTRRWLSQLRPLPEVTGRPELTVIEGKARRRSA
jgi:hypothetical protein